MDLVSELRREILYTSGAWDHLEFILLSVLMHCELLLRICCPDLPKNEKEEAFVPTAEGV